MGGKKLAGLLALLLAGILLGLGAHSLSTTKAESGSFSLGSLPEAAGPGHRAGVRQDSAQRASESADSTEKAYRAAIARANEAVARARLEAGKDPSRPAFHFQAPALWMNDPNGPIQYQGEYHLFYQHNPYGAEWGNIHWGHAKSRDLVHWQHLPIALAPSNELGEEHCFSGSAVIHDGTPTIFYTSIGPGTPSADGAVQWMATSLDGMLTWQKYAGNPIMTGEVNGSRLIHEWRDPFVWKEGDEWRMTLGGIQPGGKGCVLIYRSLDLIRWECLGVLYEEGTRAMECPLFFRLGEKWVLVYSPYGLVKYHIGILTPQNLFVPEFSGTLDHSETFYAPNCMLDDKGRRLLWGWLRIKGEGWNGMFTVPRVLSLRPDGRLRVEPAKELEVLRMREVELEKARGGQLEIVAEFEPDNRTTVGLQVRRDASEEPLVTFDPVTGNLRVGEVQTRFQLLPDEKSLRLHVLIDRSVMEVYANSRECITVPFSSLGNLSYRILDSGPHSEPRILQVWELGSSR